MSIYIFSLLFFKVLIDEKCIASDLMPTPAPEGYNLVYSSLLLSVGATAPTKQFLDADQTDIWQCDSPGSSSVRIESAPVDNPRRIHHLIDSRVSDFYPNCREGDLTLEGMEQMHQLGQKYSKYFVDTVKQLQNYLIPEDISLVSAYDESSYRSLLSFLDGFYPPQYQEEFLNIVTGSEIGDVLRPDPSYCSNIQESYYNYSNGDFQALLSEANTTLEELFSYLKIENETFNKMDPKTFLSACEYLHAFSCSNRQFPSNILALSSVCEDYTKQIINQQYGKYGGSYTFREIITHLNRFFSGIDSTKVSIFSGLPTTMVEVLKILGQKGIHYPLYRAHLLIEFFRKHNDVYVRVSYNGKLINIPGLALYENQFYEMSPFHNFVKSQIHPQTKICKEMP